MEKAEHTLNRLAGIVTRGERSPENTKQIAEMIRSARDYRWVGIYEVTPTEIAAIAWTGTESPAHPRFPITQGLCGAAVKSRAPVVAGDVRNAPRYLTTFGNTRSEIVVPILEASGNAAGLIDVESERPDAFSSEDMQFLESCARIIQPIFL